MIYMFFAVLKRLKFLSLQRAVVRFGRRAFGARLNFNACGIVFFLALRNGRLWGGETILFMETAFNARN